ncbi:hypothetical protein DL762_002081 [Monosporascus cannonballus]|uniref:Mid2 domain-containing protein n=1 Tax=Monosporascus cannonballus TaxID=155416 RepID=A0ABY0HEZ8_9PEZI|nr:hypothetical protein DL762_002081 [Monosporascus cannonballus]
MAESLENLQGEAIDQDDQCPLGDKLKWWACSNPLSHFRGCCSIDPCAGAECPDPIEWQHPNLDLSDDTATTSTEKTTRISTRMSVGPPVSVSSSTEHDIITATIISFDIISGELIPFTTIVITITGSDVTVERTTTSTDAPTSRTIDTILTSSTIEDAPRSSTIKTALTDPTSSSAANNSTSSTGEAESGRLSSSAIIGISIGSSSAVLFVGCLIFLLIRRRKRSNRVLSVGAASPPRHHDGKFVGTPLSRPTVSTEPTVGVNGDDDVFAPFGGHANSQRAFPNPLPSHAPRVHIRAGGSSMRQNHPSSTDTFVNTPSSVTSSTQPVCANKTSSDAIAEEVPELESPRPGSGVGSAVAREITMVRPNSQPRCIELESPGSDGVSAPGKSAPAELPTPTSVSCQDSRASQAQTQSPTSSGHQDACLRPVSGRTATGGVAHPLPLTPGFPGTQMRIQGCAPDMEHDRQSGDVQQEQTSQLRPNLNPTSDEREKNQYVTSWAQL